MRLMARGLVLMLVGALLAAAPVGLAIARPVWPQSGELLTNPDFEDPFNGGVAAGWQSWYITPGAPGYPAACKGGDATCKPYAIPTYNPSQPQDTREPPRAISGNSQKWGTTYAVFIAGVSQQVGNIAPGTRLNFSASTQGFNCDDDRGCFGSAAHYGYSYEPGDMQLRVGIDPTGGTNAFAPTVVWSAYANPLDAFVKQSVEVVAQSDKVTVFVWASPTFPEKHTEVYVDDASLVAVGQGPAPTSSATEAAQPTPAAGTPAPTVTLSPNATTYTVVSGDTLTIIAQRFNLTLDQLLALNPGLARDSVIQVGQVVNVSGQAPTLTATPAAATTAAAATVAAATATVAATVTPQPSPTSTASATPTVGATAAPTTTSPTSTPMAVAATSGLCVQAFDDRNNDLVREAGEPLVAGVAFDVKSADGKTTANYTTDGTKEPYCFSTLPDGRYTVSTQLPNGLLATTDSAWQMSLLAGTNVSIMLGTRVNAPPTLEPTVAPTAAAALAETTAPTARPNNTAPMLLLGGGALILLAGVAMFFGLRSRRKSA